MCAGQERELCTHLPSTAFFSRLTLTLTLTLHTACTSHFSVRQTLPMGNQALLIVLLLAIWYVNVPSITQLISMFSAASLNLSRNLHSSIKSPNVVITSFGGATGGFSTSLLHTPSFCPVLLWSR